MKNVLTLLLIIVSAGLSAAEDAPANKPVNLSLLPKISINGAENSTTSNYVALSLLGGRSRNIHGLSISPIHYRAAGNVAGLQSALIANLISGKIYGMQHSVIFNSSGGGCGFQNAGILNMSRTHLNGYQTALVNMSDSLNGVQTGTVNMSRHLRGVQLGVVNIAHYLTGLQAGVVNITRKEVRNGAQIGVFNFAGRANGMALGVFNICGKPYLSTSMAYSELGVFINKILMGSERVHLVISTHNDLWGTKLNINSGGLGTRIPVNDDYYMQGSIYWGGLYETINTGWPRGTLRGIVQMVDVSVGRRIIPHVSAFAGLSWNNAFGLYLYDNKYVRSYRMKLDSITDESTGWLGFALGVQVTL